MPDDVIAALRWQASRTAGEVISQRESVIRQLEAAGEAMWKRGICQEWLSGADPQVARVSSTVNGVMLTDLCRAIQYDDMDCVELFRKGEYSIENIHELK